jgi:hypothetical protein
MYAILTVLETMLILLTVLLLVGWFVVTVLEHARSNPAAAKALYEHVFLPVFIGKADIRPDNAASDAKPDGVRVRAGGD